MYRYNTFVSISIFRNEFNQLMKTLDVSAEFQFFFSFLFSLLGVALQLLSFLTLRPGS